MLNNLLKATWLAWYRSRTLHKSLEAPGSRGPITFYYPSRLCQCAPRSKEGSEDEAASNQRCGICLARERPRQQEVLFETRVNISMCLWNWVLISFGRCAALSLMFLSSFESFMSMGDLSGKVFILQILHGNVGHRYPWSHNMLYEI